MPPLDSQDLSQVMKQSNNAASHVLLLLEILYGATSAVLQKNIAGYQDVTGTPYVARTSTCGVLRFIKFVVRRSAASAENDEA